MWNIWIVCSRQTPEFKGHRLWHSTPRNSNETCLIILRRSALNRNGLYVP